MLTVSVLFLCNINQRCYSLLRGVPLYKSLYRVKHFLLDREAAAERSAAASRSSRKLCTPNLCRGGNKTEPTSEFYRHAYHVLLLWASSGTESQNKSCKKALKDGNLIRDIIIIVIIIIIIYSAPK